MTYSITQKSQLEGALRLDAEYFQPKYLDVENSIRRTNIFKVWGDIDGKFITGPFGSEFNVENYIPSGKFRYVRGKDVKKFFLEENDNVYVPENDFNRLRKYSLVDGDILISVVGTNGNTVVIDDNNLPSMFSCKSTVFRGKINPYYLITFLNCRYGQQQLERNARGAVQTGLNIDDLRSVLIYIPAEKSQLEISNSIMESKNELSNSKEFYNEAENLLLKGLVLENFEVEQKLYSVVNFSDCQKANRIDAEYFQPKFFELFEIISKNSRVELLGNVSKIQRGSLIDPQFYSDSGIQYIRGADFSNGRVSREKAVFIDEKFQHKNETIVNSGDIVFASIGSVGNLAIVDQNSADSYISNNLSKIVSLNEGKVIPEYLLVVLRSIIGQSLFEKESSQTAQPKISDSQVKSFMIPILPKSTQEKIADLVRKSHSARKKSKALLEEAKRKVEELIEKGNK